MSIFDEKRRYRVVEGRLQKKWTGDEDGWFVTKAEAWAAWEQFRNPPPAPRTAPESAVEGFEAPEVSEPPQNAPAARKRGRPRKNGPAK